MKVTKEYDNIIYTLSNKDIVPGDKIFKLRDVNGPIKWEKVTKYYMDIETGGLTDQDDLHIRVIKSFENNDPIEKEVYHNGFPKYPSEVKSLMNDILIFEDYDGIYDTGNSECYFKIIKKG